ncbi:hypothetical protein LTR47_004392 [Exophiala xenobiotica]|nr:hypothetical protein LTR72_002848 [Exophiala xenobiotica]KAK5234359.1 hypothetical protein LTR47_004392 [Exophiala xenobiotica]KAK5254832.1 hypothetical protein LTS06_000971 [Exophiala xenobiotica]KAK5262023.1 hypothetical protein LTR40_001095 [Exophiala xenobiotica]KAK5300608.1 hypothetical protein LTR14_001005 [Exophiala xenobiotica]
MGLRVALVTASSAGLGAAIAKSIVDDFRVVINYHGDAARAEATLNQLKTLVETRSSHEKVSDKVTTAPAHNLRVPRVLALRADMGSRASIAQLVKDVVDQMGRLDVVISNGGWTRIRDFQDLDDNVNEEDWDRCWNVNVKSHLWLLHASKQHLESSPNGAFISIASVAGVKPSGSSIAYAVTKAAQIHLMKCLAAVVSPLVRVNCVSPGILMTDWGRQFPDDKLTLAKERTLLKRFATVEDVAEQVKSMVLSNSITGVNMVVDAGFSL